MVFLFFWFFLFFVGRSCREERTDRPGRPSPKNIKNKKEYADNKPVDIIRKKNITPPPLIHLGLLKGPCLYTLIYVSVK